MKTVFSPVKSQQIKLCPFQNINLMLRRSYLAKGGRSSTFAFPQASRKNALKRFHQARAAGCSQSSTHLGVAFYPCKHISAFLHFFLMYQHLFTQLLIPFHYFRRSVSLSYQALVEASLTTRLSPTPLPLYSCHFLLFICGQQQLAAK